MIKRSAKSGKFTTIDNDVLVPGVLSWQARGLLVTILSKPDHWKVLPKALVNETDGSAKKTAINGVYSILKEIRDAGFAYYRKCADGSSEYTIFDSRKDCAEWIDANHPDQPKPNHSNDDQPKPNHSNDDDIVKTDSLVKTDSKQSTENKEALPFSDQMKDYSVNEKFISEILKHRRDIKSKKPTPKAMNLILRGMSKAVTSGVLPSMNDCLDHYVNETTWQGFNPDWIKTDNRNGGSNGNSNILEQQAKQLGIDGEENYI